MAGVHFLVTCDWMPPVSISAASLNWMIGPPHHPPPASSWLSLSLSFHAGVQRGCRSESTSVDITCGVLSNNSERRCSASAAPLPVSAGRTWAAYFYITEAKRLQLCTYYIHNIYLSYQYIVRYYHVNNFNISGYKTNKIPLLKDELITVNLKS